MALHDAYARVTPFELAFSGGPDLGAFVAAVEEEARLRGADATEPEGFMTLTAVGERVRSLRPADAPPEATYPLASLLFQVVRFERAGRPLYLLATGAARSLAGARFAVHEPTAGPPKPLAPAGYLQLPRHLVWTEGGGERPSVPGAGGPESLDGVFWSVSLKGVLHALPISGLLPDRPGFGALPLPGAPLSDAAIWLDATARPSGADFASTLPGGELDELYTVRTAGEVLKLLARFYVLVGEGRARLESRRPGVDPEREEQGAAVAGRAGAGRPSGAPRPSALPYTRVSLLDRVTGPGET